MPRGAGEIAGVLAALDTLAEWLAPHPGPSRHVMVPDVRGLFAGPCQYAAGAAGLRLETVQLTAHPMPVEGLIVDQSPPAWHQGPPVRHLDRAGVAPPGWPGRKVTRMNKPP